MDKITSVKTYCLTIPRDVPYLGALGAADQGGGDGLFIRGGNRSVYSMSDHCVLVRIETSHGAVGWGECVSVVAPQVAATAIESLIRPLILGRDPTDVMAIGEDLYDSMRVRGFFGGFWGGCYGSGRHRVMGLERQIVWSVRGSTIGGQANGSHSCLRIRFAGEYD